MKKIKKEVLQLLKNRTVSYHELAKITGYHAKYLIKLNKEAQKNNYIYVNKNIGKKNHLINDNIKNIVKEEWLKYYDKSYIEFYKHIISKYNFKISYSFLCKYLSNIDYNINCLIIKKIKKDNIYFNVAIDYQTKTILNYNENKKNNYKSVKELLLKIFMYYGIPANITFINLFKNNNPFNKILKKYDIKLIASSYKFSKIIALNNNNIPIKYFKKNIDLKDFYEQKNLKTISDNTIQFNNIRYKIESDIIIKHLENVTLFYNNVTDHKFITYKQKEFILQKQKILSSKKGLSKYN